MAVDVDGAGSDRLDGAHAGDVADRTQLLRGQGVRARDEQGGVDQVLRARDSGDRVADCLGGGAAGRGAAAAGGGAAGRARVAGACEAASDLCVLGVAAVCRTVAAPAPVASGHHGGGDDARPAPPYAAAVGTEDRDGERKRRCTVAPPLVARPRIYASNETTSPRVTRRNGRTL